MVSAKTAERYKTIMIKKIIPLVLLLLVTLLFASCAGAENGEENEGISIVTTVFPQYDFAKKLTEGTSAKVKMLIPAGSEAHTYDPTPADMIAAAKSDIFIWVGGESEAWTEKIIKSTLTEKTKVIALMDTVLLLESNSGHGQGYGHDDGKEHDHSQDEHVWTSPKNAIEIVKVICTTLCEIDYENSDIYRKNAEEYLSSLSELDGEFEALAMEISGRPLIIGDRFPFLYLADAYGLEFVSPFKGCSSHTEASMAEMASVIETARENGAKTIFSVDFSNEKMAKSIAGEVGASVSRLYSCHTASGDDIDAGRGYIEIMQKNLSALSKAYK